MSFFIRCTAVLFAALAMLAATFAAAQTAQVGGDREARGTEKMRIEYVHYRPAKWNTEQITEYENEHPNQGGLLYIYFRNTGDKPLDLRYWRANGQDESYWVLNHFVAWHRLWNNHTPPGGLGVLEINATSEDFGEGEEFAFAYVDRSWAPVATYTTELVPDPVQVSHIRVLPGMEAIEVHVRHTGGDALSFQNLAVENHEVTEATWRTDALEGPGHTIVRASLAKPLTPSELLVTGVTVRTGFSKRTVYAHRRAFVDAFPIGIWRNDPELWDRFHRLHIDTFVSGHNPEDKFYTEAAPKYGFKGMVHTGMPLSVDAVRALADEPAVSCWMIRDEPDWSIPANIMNYADQSVRKYNSTKPTFITLCRNIKFMEYAPISDIPCQDHYSVTAPSSSKWPHFYGTRLEETGYYTEDLKYAAEPKGVWVWTQGIADWSERPKRPVPTPNELAVQLVQNLGYGAKGILWFNWSDKHQEKYPEAVDAMQHWGRVMKVLRQDFLAAEPANLDVHAPAEVDVMPLVNWNTVLLCVTNRDYDLHPEAYPFRTQEQVAVSFDLPAWMAPKAALAIDPDGVKPLPLDVDEGRATITFDTIEAARTAVLMNDPARQQLYEQAYNTAVNIE